MRSKAKAGTKTDDTSSVDHDEPVSDNRSALSARTNREPTFGSNANLTATTQDEEEDDAAAFGLPSVSSLVAKAKTSGAFT